uniref:Transposon protein, putative, unclassified n=1 Tax=Oryza sativa subsp. japonica TaxID=39947 RepID=Q2QS03_ORYSJ|nr:transposon protein, putative, unclassified [Oryza sativa Japonica Group]
MRRRRVGGGRGGGGGPTARRGAWRRWPDYGSAAGGGDGGFLDYGLSTVDTRRPDIEGIGITMGIAELDDIDETVVELVRLDHPATLLL